MTGQVAGSEESAATGADLPPRTPPERPPETQTLLARSRHLAGVGLRAKAIAMMVMVTVACMLLAAVVGGGMVSDIRYELGATLARENASQTMERTRARLGQDLALSQRLAASFVLREWLKDEQNTTARDHFLQEAAGYQNAFDGGSYFVVHGMSGNYYFSGKDEPFSKRYAVSADNPENAWYYKVLDLPDGYQVNVDYDARLGLTNVWINVVTGVPGQPPFGVVGSAIDLTKFLAESLRASGEGVTTLIVDHRGIIVAHPDRAQMELRFVAKDHSEKTLFNLVDNPAEAERLRGLLAQAAATPDAKLSGVFRVDGEERVIAASYLSLLNWTAVTMVDLSGSGVLSSNRVIGVVAIAVLLLLAMLGFVAFGVDRLVLSPLSRLTAMARLMAKGDYGSLRDEMAEQGPATLRGGGSGADGILSHDRKDELGELSRVFDSMAQQVLAHSADLENQVAQRTGELVLLNSQLSATNLTLTDSIRYASLIQGALLPDAALQGRMAGRHFVLWRPRDVVGGDLYIYREDERGLLFGVVDCAGHGVAGAIMTMLAHATLDMAVSSAGLGDPARILTLVDQAARTMLPGDQGSGQTLATTMEMGLAYAEHGSDRLIFAGARMGLFWGDASPCETGDHCGHIGGNRRGLNERRQGTFENIEVPTRPGRCYYILSDGLLDQSGGERGFAFGQSRFASWVEQNADKPMIDQGALLAKALDQYQGGSQQRDDITVMAVRLVDPA